MQNSKLYEIYTEQYEEFFANNDLIISIPYSISIFGWTACVFGWPVLNQSIPQRAYIGYKKNVANSGINITSYKQINHKNDTIEDVIGDTFYSPDLIFKKHLQDLYPNIDLSISILTEFDGKNADIISGWVILWIDLFIEKIDQDNICLLKWIHCKDLYKNNYIQELLKKTLLLRINYNSWTIGWSCLDAFISWFIDSDLPILHIQEKYIYGQENKTAWKNEILKRIDLWEIKYLTNRTEELLDVSFSKDLPFDIMMFTLGEYRNIWWYQTFLNWTDNSISTKALLQSEHPEIFSDFFLETSEKNSLLYKSIEVISEYIYHVHNMYLKTLSAQEKLSTFFFYLKRNIEIINSLLWKYNISSHEWEDQDILNLSLTLWSLYPSLHKDDYFIYTTGSSVDLKYVVLIPKYIPTYSKEYINNELKSHFDKKVFLTYSSKTDWFEKEWIKIEQFISKGIRNKFSWNKKILIINQNGNIKLFDNKEKAIIYSNKWILLDTINKKIYIYWDILNSNDLVSQNATVDILGSLFEKFWKEIENSEFAKSSYTKNKNEMNSKIILPIIKIINEKFGYQFPIECKGSINEFYLKLNKPEIEFFLLKKH